MHQIPTLRCYEIDISKFDLFGRYQFKKDTYEIKLPGEEPKKFNVEGEWLDGKPHGICIVTTLSKKYLKSIMTFTHGVNDGPGWIDFKDQNYFCRWSFSKYDSEEGFDFGL